MLKYIYRKTVRKLHQTVEISTGYQYYYSILTLTFVIAQISAGVPRDGILSPTLFNNYASDQPTIQSTFVADYTDDSIILSIN